MALQLQNKVALVSWSPCRKRVKLHSKTSGVQINNTLALTGINVSLKECGVVEEDVGVEKMSLCAPMTKYLSWLARLGKGFDGAFTLDGCQPL